MPVLRQHYLSRTRTLGFLEELETSTDIARSLYLPSGLPHSELEGLLQDPELAELVAGSPTGAALFWSPSQWYLILPPFPIEEKNIAPGGIVAPLRSLLESEFKIALILVRLGAYAIGVCQGEKLMLSKVGTGLVHGRHKKGGSSQHRFQRHREKQIETFLGRVCERVEEKLASQALDYLVYGGAKTTIQLFQKRCPFLQQFNHCTLPPLLDIHEPRQEVLEAAVKRVWSSRLIEWHEED